MTGYGGSQTYAADLHPFALPGATEHYAADRPAVVEHMRIEVDLDFQQGEIRGRCNSRLRAVRDVSIVTFDAVELEVRQVRVNGKAAVFSNTGAQLNVSLPEPLSADGVAEVTIHYRTRPNRGLYFWGPDKQYPNRPLQAWTQGQDEDARAWFPCLDAPAQKATTEVIATFPSSMTALSNGALVDDRRKRERRTMHYRLDFPHSPYLVTLVVGEFEKFETTAGETSLQYLFPRGRKADALRCLENTPRMIRHFEDLTGIKYPFRSYAQVFVTEFIFGGMENTSATTLMDTVLHDARAHADYSTDPLVSHELAHQWFGDLITCREWPHAWLNEGFATYFETLWNEHALGIDEADQHRREELEAYVEEAKQRYARPIIARKFHLPIELFDRHLYQKAALVLHDLRSRLGNDLFFRGLRHYAQKNSGGAVETRDFGRALEEATGHNLDQFLDQYFFSPGHPELKVEVRYEAAEQRVRLKVQQVQKTEGPEARPVYRLRLPVRVVLAGRARDEQLEISDREHVFFVPCEKSPTQVVIDPRRDVFATLDIDKPLDLWIEELRRATEGRCRMDAAMALAKNGSASALDALATALAKDRFWGVQAACARALGMIRSPNARRALLRSLAVKHPKARRAVVAALGEFRRDEEAAGALRRLCEKGDSSYFVEGEAARSLGKLRLGETLPLLKKLTRRSSFMDVIATGAIQGIAATLDPDGFDIVLPLVRYGQPPFIRRAAAMTIAKLAEPAQKKREAAEVLGDLLRDPEFRMRMAVISAVQELGDPRLVPALERMLFQDGRTQRAAREAARSLRQDEVHGQAVSSLRDEVDRLKEETRGLRERLEALEPKLKGRKRS
jgi:aminopeptidase N